MKFFRINLAVVFIWIGFILSISFMEAWLKFQAPGITLGLGLGIGKLVFGTMNKIEWLFAITILFYISQLKTFWTAKNSAFLVTVGILLVQSFWLLPELANRADLFIEGKVPGKSSLHLCYIILEVIKLGCLSFFGIKLLNLVK